jgi:hypothetical protein
LPPISTLRAGLRAIWVNFDGAVSHSLRARPRGHAHPLAFDIGAGLAPAVQRGGVLDEVDADLFQHRFGVVLDDLERLFVQDLEVRECCAR